MKRVIFVFIIATIAFISCKKDNKDLIIGKWQTVENVYVSDIGKDSLDMRGANEFFTFREDNTMYITNGEKEVNSNYFIKGSIMHSFVMGGSDTVKSQIIKLDNKSLTLSKELNNFDNTKVYIHLERAK